MVSNCIDVACKSLILWAREAESNCRYFLDFSAKYLIVSLNNLRIVARFGSDLGKLSAVQKGINFFVEMQSMVYKTMATSSALIAR